MEYLRERFAALTVERFEAKLILVGEGGMGKSSLLRAWQQQPFNPQLPATHGIMIGTLQVPHPTQPGAVITLNTWDFGGQAIYQATQQIFLTRRSVYLVVWNPRWSEEICRLPFWLDTIKALAPDAQVILVPTHRDLWQTHIDLPDYKRRYPQIVDLCAVSNLKNTGLEALKELVASAAAETQLVGLQWPRRWVEAEQQLLARPEHHIDLRAFLACCAEHQVDATAATESLGPTLHDLGKILYFQDDSLLKNLIVLKPDWIIAAISRILNDPHVQMAGGIVAHSDLSRIWAIDEDGQSYDPSLYPTFLRLMERFDLCYQLEADEQGEAPSHSLIPLLLPPQRPGEWPIPPDASKADQARIEMRYTLTGFVPAGLMSRFLVRTHRYSQGLHWQYGAQLVYEGQLAQVELLGPDRRQIRLVAWGSFPSTFFMLLKETLDTLLSRFQDIQVTQELACTCERQALVPHFYAYDDLARLLERGGKARVFCRESAKRIPVATLLYGLHPVTTPQVITSIQQSRQELSDAPSTLALNEIQERLDVLGLLLERVWHGQVRAWNLEMQRIEKPCPGLFILKPLAGRVINPKDWVGRAYQLHLLCQYPAHPHLLRDEPGYEVRQSKQWWHEISPWLGYIVEVLKVGVPMGKVLGQIFDQARMMPFAPELDTLEEILDDLSDIQIIDEVQKMQGDFRVPIKQQAALRTLYHFLDEVDHTHWWQGLSQVVTPDGTILWLCEEHRQEFEAPLVQL